MNSADKLLDELSNQFVAALSKKDICALDEMISEQVEVNLNNHQKLSKLEFIDQIQNEDLCFDGLQIISKVGCSEVQIKGFAVDMDGHKNKAVLNLHITKQTEELVISYLLLKII